MWNVLKRKDHEPLTFFALEIAPHSPVSRPPSEWSSTPLVGLGEALREMMPLESMATADDRRQVGAETKDLVDVP